VILADDVIDAQPPAIKQMIEVFKRVSGRCSPSNASSRKTFRVTA
jgi:UTP-glucose-1-phosphate uridylyltransferase